MYRNIVKSLAFFLIIGSFLYADVPNTVNYQGRLTDSSGNPVADGTYSMTFKIYNIESGDSGIPCGDEGANCLWEETQSVETKNGLFNAMLGSVNPVTATIFSEANRWLGITVESDSEMTPRQKFASSAYALKAKPPSQEELTCPSNMVKAGSFCIDRDRKSPKNWFEAAQTCQSENKRLCSAVEWYQACWADIPGLNDIGGSCEWVNDLFFGDFSGNNHYQAILVCSCEGEWLSRGRLASTTSIFRCCQ